MSLSFPSTVGRMTSVEAQKNISTLLHVNHRSPKDQVATTVALRCLQKQKEMQSGRFFKGITSWIKSGTVYCVAGAAAIASIGAGGYAVYEGLKLGVRAEYITTPWALGILAALSGTGIVAKLCEYNPMTAPIAFLVLTVRDAANRGAEWSTRGDLRAIKENDTKAAECHKTIVSQLTTVYDDCANKIQEMLEDAEKTQTTSSFLCLQKTVNILEDRIPTIKKLLQGFKLEIHEIEMILQRLINSIKYVQSQTSQLMPNSEKRNLGLLIACPAREIGNMAIPMNIKDRIDIYRNSQFGIAYRFKGYAGAVWSGGLTFAALTTTATAVIGGLCIYRYGKETSINFLKNLNFKTLSIRDAILSPDYPKTKAILGSTALGIFGISTSIMAVKSREHHSKIVSNKEFVDSEIDLCKNDLKNIYDGMALCLKSLPKNEQKRLAGGLAKRLPQINQAIGYLGFTPTAISRNLELTVRSVLSHS